MIPPTIGRVLWYYPHRNTDQPWPALVAYVHEDGKVNLGGFRDDGTPFNASEVPLIQDGAPVPSHNYATWMPYQVKQAAIAESQSTGLKPLNSTTK